MAASRMPLPAISVVLSRVSSPVISMASSRVPSPAISVALSRVPSVASSRAPSIVPLMGPSSYPPSSCSASPMGLDQGVSGSDGNNNIADPGGEEEGNTSEREDDDMDNFMDASRTEPKMKDDICLWEELREQLKSDMVEGYKKNESPTILNKLTILQNFTTLYIKGVRHITMSEEIAQQFHKGMGHHFAHQI
jgi:hypothetical protein